MARNTNAKTPLFGFIVDLMNNRKSKMLKCSRFVASYCFSVDLW